MSQQGFMIALEITIPHKFYEFLANVGVNRKKMNCTSWKINSIQLLPTKDWHNLGPSGSTRSLPKGCVGPSPFYQGPAAAIRGVLPGGNRVEKIKVDIAHTYAISGYGKDDLASGIVFLSHHCKIFGEAKIEIQLDRAYMAFKQYCIEHGKTTSIQDFSYQELKIVSFLGFYHKFMDIASDLSHHNFPLLFSWPHLFP